MPLPRLLPTLLGSILALAAAAPALAAGGPDRYDDGRDRHGPPAPERGDRPDRGGRYDAGPRHGGGWGYGPPPGYYRSPPPLPPPVAYRPAPPPRWHRGDYYRGPVYVVSDYRYHRLRPPPPGYRWVRDDRGDFLMVAIATGIITDLILRH